MAGTLRPAVIVILSITAVVAVVGAALWIAGATVVVRPTSFVAASTFRDPTSLSTQVDESRSITFTVALVTDQPWISDGFKPYNVQVSAAPGTGVSDIRISNLPVFLCEASCSPSNFLYVDIPIMNETAPNHWVSYPAEFLFGMDWGTPVYITYAVPLMVSFADGSYYAGQWSSGVRLAPIVALPDNAELGQVIFTWGALLFSGAMGITVIPRYTEARRER